jgi:diguanylate cyclase (GGDEF)-like protein
MKGRDMRSPEPRTRHAVIVDQQSDWLDALCGQLVDAGFTVETLAATELAFGAFVSGASIVVVAQPAQGDLEQARVEMTERVPAIVPVTAVFVAEDRDNMARWLGAGFDDVFSAADEPAEVGARLIARAANRDVQDSLGARDRLTGLHGRQIFFSRLDPMVHLSSRASMPLAVAVIDMDGFRALEQRLGRALVRQALKDAAKHLQQALRRSDTIARIGDDRFGLILHHISAFEARKLLYKLWRSIAPSPATLEMAGSESVEFTFTAGVAVFPGDSSDGMELYTRAEVALDVARATGNRRILLYSETSGEAGQHSGSTDLRYHRVRSAGRDKPE